MTVNELLNQTVLNTILPAGDYLVTLTVEAEPMLDQETNLSENVRTEDSLTHTVESTISVNAEISISEADPLCFNFLWRLRVNSDM